MSFIGNLIWFLLGGFLLGLGWIIAGILWCITIIGIPLGIQCFKIAGVAMFPFGRKVVNNGSAMSLLLNILWICISGVELAVAHLIIGLLFCITIVPSVLKCCNSRQAMFRIPPQWARLGRKPWNPSSSAGPRAGRAC